MKKKIIWELRGGQQFEKFEDAKRTAENKYANTVEKLAHLLTKTDGKFVGLRDAIDANLTLLAQILDARRDFDQVDGLEEEDFE